MLLSSSLLCSKRLPLCLVYMTRCACCRYESALYPVFITF